MKYGLLILHCVLVLAACKNPEVDRIEPITNNSDSLDLEMERVLKTNILPGFGVLVFTSDSTLYSRGFGYADKESKKPYTTYSVQLIASISKTLVGTSLMLAMRQSKVHPDNPANDYLPFDLTHQLYPTQDISLRHLANHTSGIEDPNNYKRTYLFPDPIRTEHWPKAWKELIPYYDQNKRRDLDEFLTSLVQPEGDLYEDGIFTEHPPGNNYNYSNVGTSLLALCIQEITKTPFDEYTAEQILKPLGMHQSSWNPQEISAEDHVTYYLENGYGLRPYTLITYPDGGLYTSMEDLRIFGQELLKSARGGGKLLTKQEFEMMTHPSADPEQFPDAICWDLSVSPLIGHGGNDFGTSTLFYLNPEKGLGYILFANSSIETEQQENTFYGIYNSLFQYDW